MRHSEPFGCSGYRQRSDETPDTRINDHVGRGSIQGIYKVA